MSRIYYPSEKYTDEEMLTIWKALSKWPEGMSAEEYQERLEECYSELNHRGFNV
jgi:hypothetical protein